MPTANSSRVVAVLKRVDAALASSNLDAVVEELKVLCSFGGRLTNVSVANAMQRLLAKLAKIPQTRIQRAAKELRRSFSLGDTAAAHAPALGKDGLLRYMESPLELGPAPQTKYAAEYAYRDDAHIAHERILFVDEYGDEHVSTEAIAKERCGDGPLTEPGNFNGDVVIYWMSRDQRVADNWALLRAQQVAEGRGQTLVVAFCLLLPAGFLGACGRHFGFMLRGLKQVEYDLGQLNIPFVVLHGDQRPEDKISDFAQKSNASLVVSDYSPLRIAKEWRRNLGKKLAAHSPAVEYEVVDAHNVVPVWVASNKAEFSARTIRIKLWKTAPTWMAQSYPAVKEQKVPNARRAVKQEHGLDLYAPVNWSDILRGADGLESLNWDINEVCLSQFAFLL